MKESGHKAITGAMMQMCRTVKPESTGPAASACASEGDEVEGSWELPMVN
jgi:hypothetical protein